MRSNLEKDNCIKVGYFYKLKNNLGLNDFTFFYYTITIISILLDLFHRKIKITLYFIHKQMQSLLNKKEYRWILVNKIHKIVQCNLVSWGKKINGNYSYSNRLIILSKKETSQITEILNFSRIQHQCFKWTWLNRCKGIKSNCSFMRILNSSNFKWKYLWSKSMFIFLIMKK